MVDGDLFEQGVGHTSARPEHIYLRFPPRQRENEGRSGEKCLVLTLFTWSPTLIFLVSAPCGNTACTCGTTVLFTMPPEERGEREMRDA